MSTNQQQPVNMFVSLLVVALLGLGLYWFTSAMIDKLNSINSDLGKALITGAVTIFVAVISLVIGKLWEQQVKIQQEIREKKIPVYEKQIETFFSVVFAEKYGEEKPSQDELAKAFQAFTEKLIIWGSAEVIQAWSAFRLHDWQSGDPANGFLKVETLLRAIRKDLGNSNSNLAVGDIMRLFINDFPVGEAIKTSPHQEENGRLLPETTPNIDRG